MLKIFSRRERYEDWSEVYNTTDPWEAEVVRAALLSAGIRARVKIAGQDRKDRQNVVSVPNQRLSEAELVIHRTSLVISKKEDILAEQREREQEELASPTVKSLESIEPVIPEIKPTGEAVLLAEKDNVGKIFYYEEEDKYELRLELEFYKGSHYMSSEEWEEFIDFSAQRQEFFILLKEKYPALANLVKENKMRPDLLKLIEYSYGKSQPPKR